jgi:ribosomal protein S18 acetylase RimI-like enzyme
MDRDTVNRVRAARADDVAAIARVEVETWRATYPGMLPDRVLVGMSEDRQKGSWSGLVRYRPGDVLVAEWGDAGIVGFGNCGAQRDGTLDYAGEIFTLYVAPEAQNQGVGRHLLRGLFERLVEKGRPSALIWVIRANPSRFFYERVGGKLILTRRIRVGGVLVEAVAYGWSDLAATVVR